MATSRHLLLRIAARLTAMLLAIAAAEVLAAPEDAPGTAPVPDLPFPTAPESS